MLRTRANQCRMDFREGQARFEAAVAAFFVFAFDEEREPIVERQAVVLGALELFLPGAGHTGQPQFV